MHVTAFLCACPNLWRGRSCKAVESARVPDLVLDHSVCTAALDRWGPARLLGSR